MLRRHAHCSLQVSNYVLLYASRLAIYRFKLQCICLSICSFCLLMLGIEDHRCTFSHTSTHTRSVGLWTCRGGLYLHNTQYPAKTNLHARCRIRTRHPSNRTAPYLRLRQCGQRDLHSMSSKVKYWLQYNVPCCTFIFQSVFRVSFFLSRIVYA